MWQSSCCLTEMKLLLVFWLLVMLTWLWAGLHMAYQLLSLLVMFCIFSISLVRVFQSRQLSDSRPICANYDDDSP